MNQVNVISYEKRDALMSANKQRMCVVESLNEILIDAELIVIELIPVKKCNIISSCI